MNGHIREIPAAIADFSIDNDRKMILSYDPGQVIVYLRPDCASPGKTVIVTKYRLVEADGFPGKPFVGMVVHVDAEQKIEIVSVVEADA